MTQRPHISEFFVDEFFDGAKIGVRVDWEAYHAACDKRDKPKLRVIDGGREPDLPGRGLYGPTPTLEGE
jgi:hypothetical protein